MVLARIRLLGSLVLIARDNLAMPTEAKDPQISATASNQISTRSIALGTSSMAATAAASPAAACIAPPTSHGGGLRHSAKPTPIKLPSAGSNASSRTVPKSMALSLFGPVFARKSYAIDPMPSVGISLQMPDYSGKFFAETMLRLPVE